MEIFLENVLSTTQMTAYVKVQGKCGLSWLISHDIYFSLHLLQLQMHV